MTRTKLVTQMNVSTLRDVEAIEKTPIEDRLAVRTTYEVIDAVAAEHGDRPAIHWLPAGYPTPDDSTITYFEFAGYVRQTANFIRGRGLGRDDVVAYLLPNLPETHYVIAGAQASSIVMPLNPLLDVVHLVSMLSAAGAKMLVTARGGLYSMLAHKAQAVAAALDQALDIVFIDMETPNADGFHSLIAQHQSDALEFEYDAQPDDPACYMHTGGTTGAPKLAAHTHWAEVTQAWTIASLADVRLADSTIAGLPLFHASAFRINGLGCWIGGASIILIGPQGFRNPDSVMHFWETVERYKATSFMTVATVYASLLNVPSEGRDISSIRIASSGAAPLPIEIIERFDEKFAIPISEGYGLTEGTCISARNPQDGERKIGSIGFRIPYQEMKIVMVDDEGAVERDCETGEVGVIALRGPNIVTSYLQKDRNKGLHLGEGWINTGDLAWMDEDGYVFITGRQKDLIIRSGHNIDPILIEDVLHAHRDVALAAAVGMPDFYAGELPVAFVTAREGAQIKARKLRDYCFEHIAERPAAPKEIFVIDEMPLTPVGKLSKLQLRCWASEHAIKQTIGDRLPLGTQCEVKASPCEQRGITARVVLTAPQGFDLESFKSAARSLLRSFSFGHELEIKAASSASAVAHKKESHAMRQIELPEWGAQNLRIASVDRPAPGPGQVLVKMEAATLNFRDLLVVQGLYNPKMPLPLVPVADGAGVIVDAGPGANKFEAATRVMPIHVPGWSGGRGEPGGAPRGGPNPGVMAEYVVFDERDLVVAPEHLSAVEAAALPCAGVTAWNGLFGGQPILPGARILILGTGGVGLFALQFAKLAGAEVAITSKDEGKLAKAKGMGADHLINYRDDENWGVTARELFKGEGADIVIELGGAHTMAQSLRAVKRGGEVAMIGSVTGAEVEKLNLPPIFMRNVMMRGIAVGSRDMFEDMTRAIALHKVTPVIDSVHHGLEAFAPALKALSEGTHFGKIGITF